MLKFLSITNLAVIDTLQIEFKPGLNLLSGETGSGKSIIIDALGLLQGERASQEMIRTGADRASIEGLFDLEGNEPLIGLLSEAGIDDLDEGLLIRRELGNSGRGRIFVNHQIATGTLLKQIQPHIIDLHGQGDQQSLLSADAQLQLLDSFAGAGEQKARVALLFEGILRTLRDLEASQQSDAERLQTLDMIQFQTAELEHAALRPKEDEELEQERLLLANAEKLAMLSHESFQILYDDESAVLARIGAVQKRIADLSALDPKFQSHLENLTAARHSVEDVAFFLRDYVEELQVTPDRLQAVEERLAEIDRLKRKYGGSIESMLARYEELQHQRESLLHHEERVTALRERLSQDLRLYQEAAAGLTSLRQDGAARLEKAVSRELVDVALSQARWEVRWKEAINPGLTERLERALGVKCAAPRKAGAETVEFYFSANPGEDLRPLSAVASGGELSRLMLVLKTVIAPSLFPRTLIFDEIDAGIGGKVADAVGQRLKRLAKTNQVLCVTHQSQIARYADAHFQVSKAVVDGRTLTGVIELDKEGRIEELARMIGGAEVTTLARKHARELLRN